MGYTEARGYVVSTSRDVADLPDLNELIVVAQTTQSESQFEARVREITARFPQAQIFNTICDATASRQAEVQELSRQAEALVVVGGRNSGNTQRLVEISQGTGIPTYHVETEQELDLVEISRYQTVAVTAGASTPNWLIGNVVNTLKHAWAFRPGSWTNYLYRVWRFFLKSNIYVAIGAGSLSYTILAAAGGAPVHLFFRGVFLRLRHASAQPFYRQGLQTQRSGSDHAHGRHRRFPLVTGFSRLLWP